MRVSYVEQVGLPQHRLRYRWESRVLTARLERPDGSTLEEHYDLSGLQPGDEVVGAEPEVLPFSPLLWAKVDEQGTLYLKLLLWYEGEFNLDRAISEAWPEGIPEEVERG